MLKCKTCNATYADLQPDGTRYFHACAPLSDAEVATALAKNPDSTKWTAQDRADVASAPRARANARDENIASTAPNDKGAPIKSAGAGVQTLP